MIPRETLTYAIFAPLLGQSFALASTDAPIALQLTEVKNLGHKRQEAIRDPFSLKFQGAAGLYLPQMIYRLRCDALGDEMEIFLTQIGNNSVASEFEAVFT